MADEGAMQVMGEDPRARPSSSTFADNECALALLDLAKSISPPNGVVRPKTEDLFSPDSLFSISSALYLNGSTDKIKKKKDSKVTIGGRTSILKRQLEFADRKSFSPPNLENYNPNIAIKLECQTREELRCELVKRIKLDHNYPCAGDFSWNRYVKALSHPSGDAPTKPHGKPTDNKSRKDHGTGPNQSSSGAKNRKSPNEPRGNSSKSPNQALEVSAPKGNINYANLHSDPLTWQQKDRKVQLVRPEESDHAKALKQGICSDLYHPNDSKYKNFNLLLKCLKTDDNGDDPNSVKEECSSVRSDSTADGSDEEMQPMAGTSFPGCSEYKCLCCSRVFQQKRYMTKHMRRMHPEVLGGEKRKQDTVTCPSCGLLVIRKSFKQHSTTCMQQSKKNKKLMEMDLANCQFCGLRMRRHILVRHLAQEHCVENIRSSNLYMMDYSDSSTLSGSEHGQELSDDEEDEEEEEGHGKDSTSYLYQDSNSLRSDATTNPASEGISDQPSESTYGAHCPQRQNTAQPSSVDQITASIKMPSCINCQLCGMRIKEDELPAHFKAAHGIDEAKPLSDPAAAKGVKQVCMHSMLQRFLSENSEEGNVAPGSSETSSEACDSCVQRLVSQSHEDDGYVSSNNNNYTSRPSPPIPTVSITKSTQQRSSNGSTNATYTIFIPKDNQGRPTHHSLSGTESKV